MATRDTQAISKIHHVIPQVLNYFVHKNTLNSRVWHYGYK